MRYNDLFSEKMRRKAWESQPESKARMLAHARNRAAAKKNRIPPWADLDAINAVYAAAKQMERETGQPHHVDHIYPLQGRYVSGLHVAQNLRVITAQENLRKHNKMPGEHAAAPLSVRRNRPR